MDVRQVRALRNYKHKIASLKVIGSGSIYVDVQSLFSCIYITCFCKNTLLEM